MKRLAKTLFIATLGLLTVTPAFAGHGRLLDRMDRQQIRIERGVESGELTRREARALRKQQRRIHRLARDFYMDDYLSKRERRILRKKLNRASDRIRALKHNDEYRYARHGYGYEHGYRDRRYDHDPDNISIWVE